MLKEFRSENMSNRERDRALQTQNRKIVTFQNALLPALGLVPVCQS